MKLLLFILGLTLITASPTLRSLQFETDSSGENTEGIFVSGNWEEDENVITDDWSWFFDEDPSNEEGLVSEEENLFPSEEEALPTEPEDLLTQVRDDPVTSGVLDFGVDTVITAGIGKGKIPNVPFTVTSISGLTKTTSEEGDLYDFSCRAVSENGNSVIEMNFTVYYDFTSERRILSSYSYIITTTTTVPTQPKPENEYVQVSEADIEADPVVQHVLEYGVAQIYAIGTQAGKIPVSEFAIKEIASVWKQVTDAGANYKCEVVLENENKATINADFTIAYASATQETTLTAYKYTVNIVNVPVPPVDNNNGTTVEGYDILSSDEISNSAEVQAVLAYGVEKVLNSGYASGKIPQSQYDITKINGVARKTQAKRTTYQCDVELEDVKEVLIQTRFVVYVNASTQEISIGSWSFNVSNIRTPNTPVDDTFTFLNETEIANSTEAQAVLAFGVDAILKSGYAKGKIPVSQYNITEIDHVAFKNENKRTVYNCKVELQDAKKVKIDAEFNVYVKANQTLDMGAWAYNVTNIRNPTNPTNNTNTTTPTQPTNNTNTTTPTGPSTNTTTPVDNNSTNSTNTTAGGFVALSNEEIHSAEVLAVLDFGSDQVLASGNAKGKIPVSDYKITRIDSVLKKVEAQRTTYRCDVLITGTNKAKIDTVFDVYVKDGNYTMGGWSYNVTNPVKPTNPTNTTNTTTPTTPTNNTNTNTTTPTQPTNNTNTNTTTPTQPTNNTNTNTTTPTTPVDNTTNTTNSTTGGFVALSDAEIHSAEVLAVLDFGSDQVLASGNAKGKIPVSDYKITRIDSVLKKVEAKRTTYKCDVVMTGANKVKVDVVFDVYAANGNYSMGGWNYNVSNLPKPQNNTNTTTTVPTTPVNSTNNTNTNTNNTTTAPTTPVNNTTNTTAPAAPTTPTTPTTPSTPVVTNNVTNNTGFTALTEVQIQAADVQAILNYGADQIIQRGTTSGKIPASDYKINKVNSVSVKTETTRTVYKCNVELQGTNKLFVRTEYNVYVKNGTQEKALGPFSYATAWV